MFDIQKFDQEIDLAMRVDQFRLRKKLRQLKKQLDSKSEALDKSLQEFSAKLESSQQRRLSRKISYAVTYPEQLPVSGKVDEIKELIQNHQVVVVAGETGSGKSTQLPKVCMELGLGEGGLIAHTQPRRIAARTLSTRIADELGSESPSGTVACKVRFSDDVQDHTQIKLMTDGMLLAEMQNDQYLDQYQCIILDEAHERSLNIDFLLAYLKRLLVKRKDLKLIITSATIDVEKMSEHFGSAPILEVGGRNFPVDIHYLYDGSEESLGEAPEVLLEGALNSILSGQYAPKGAAIASDVLVFLATEQDIRFHSNYLRKVFGERLEILPLYGRLPLSQQRRIFSESGKRRRVVLATNVAETSVTVPNIGYVIDFGLARISRYSVRNKVQQLPIEEVSQASLHQRAGRCGRVAHGVCLRVFSEDNYLVRPEFTEPEIQRTNLASVILKLASLKLGDIDQFPLIDRPDKRLVRDAYKLLEELQALTSKKQLTNLGRQISRLPLDPRFARMLLAAKGRGCVESVLAIVSGLSVNNPKLRPQASQAQADEKHSVFQATESDFLSIYKLWHRIENERQGLSNKQFKLFCEKHFLSWSSLREWRELYRQLRMQLREMNIECENVSMDTGTFEHFETHKSQKGLRDNIHKALLTGLLSHIAHVDEGFAYEGLGRKRLYIFPASVLSKKKPQWLMAAQLIETSKLFAHCCAPIQSDWVLETGEHLLSKKLFEPYWSKRQGSVMAYQQSSLGGLILEAKKPVRVKGSMGSLSESEIQDLFIQGALIERRYYKAPKILRCNWDYLDELDELERKQRRVDLVPDDREQQRFYKGVLPADINNARDFEQWLKAQDFQILDLELVMQSQKNGPEQEVAELFPDCVQLNNIDINCSYVFDPVKEEDGLNYELHFDQLNQISQHHLDWLVPGMIEEKCSALIKSLPKSLRKHCLPIPEASQYCLSAMTFGEGDLRQQLALHLSHHTGQTVQAQDFQLEKLPSHLNATVRVLDHSGKFVACSSDLAQLRMDTRGLFEREQSTCFQAGEGNSNSITLSSQKVFLGPRPIQSWDFGDLEPYVLVEKASEAKESYQVKMFAALQGNGGIEGELALSYFNSQEEAQAAHELGQNILMARSLTQFKRDLKKRFKQKEKTVIKIFSAGDHKTLFEDLFRALVDQVFFVEGSELGERQLVYRQEEFFECLERGKPKLYEQSVLLLEALEQISTKVFELRQLLARRGSALRVKHLSMIEQHLLHLVRPNFLSETPLAMLMRYPQYLEALLVRVDKLQGNIDKDQQFQDQLDAYRSELASLENRHKNAAIGLCLAQDKRAELSHLQCMLEEWAFAHFAKNKKTLMPVSDKALSKAIRAFGL